MPADFSQLKIALLESRSAAAAPVLERIGELGGECVLAPDADPAIVARLIEQGVDIVLFTASSQVADLFDSAGQTDSIDQLRDAFRRVLVTSAGPDITAALNQVGLAIDFEPDTPDGESLVDELVRIARDLITRKTLAADNGIDTLAWRRIDMRWDGFDRTIADSVFLKACRREPVPHTPVWIMRQAGRYQRAYREIREKTTMLGLCKTPELAAEVTLMAVERLGVDAAIIFADILLTLEPMGFDLEFVKGEGPVIRNPVRTASDVDRVLDGDVAALDYVCDALRLTRRALRPDIALIGFCGSPFTVATYMIEGGKSKNFRHTKTLMLTEPNAWHALMSKLVDLQVRYLNRQIDAGADALQVFGSWAGALGPEDYEQYVLPHLKMLIEGVGGRVPVINFATGNPILLPLLKRAGGDVIGLDWRVDLGEAWDALGDDVAVMGNMDPTVLYAPPEKIRQRVSVVLDQAAGRPGHIFNLGHGVSPDMSQANVAACVDAVHELSQSPGQTGSTITHE